MINAANGDYETRSAEDIKLGLDRYFSCPEADVLSFAYLLPTYSDPVLWIPGMPNPHDLFDYIAAGNPFSGHNVMFEWMAWNRICVPKYGWPELKIESLIDTMARAAAMSLPQSLGGCAEALGLPQDKLKDKRGKYLIQRLCVPHEPTKNRPGKWINDPKLLQELYDYNIQDVRVERAVMEALPELSEVEYQTWLMTQKINLRGLPVDVEEVKRVVTVVEREKERLQAVATEITGGIEVTQRNKLLEWLATKGVQTEVLDADTVAEFLDSEFLDEDARTVLQARAAVSQTSTAKFQKILDIAADDGTIKNLLVYHGAATGRFASRGGFNYQNLTRPKIKDPDQAIETIAAHYDDHDFLRMIYPDVMTAASSCVRAAIRAPAGYEFIDADFSSIENRCGPWLARDDATLDLFRKGLDEYKVFATKMYGVRYEEVTKDMRQVSKSAVLGSMFGQGHKGLVDFAAGYGVTLTLEKSKEIVDLYRADRKKIVRMWYDCGDAAMDAVRNPGKQVKVGRIKFGYDRKRDFLYLGLPSGRRIAYCQPRIQMAKAPWGEMKEVVTHMALNSITRQWERTKTIGAGFYQNAVQGAARDLLCASVFNLEAAGYKVVGLVHDEVLALVKEGEGSEEEFCQLMCTKPDWAEDLPVAAESWRGKRYQK